MGENWESLRTRTEDSIERALGRLINSAEELYVDTQTTKQEKLATFSELMSTLLWVNDRIGSLQKLTMTCLKRM